MKRIVTILSLCMLAMGLVSCAGPLGHNSMFHNRTGEYLHAQNHAFLAVPADLSSEKIGHTFYVSADGSSNGVNEIPPGSLSAAQQTKR